MTPNLFNKTQPLILVHIIHGLEDLHRILMLAPRMNERESVFGEATAPKAHSGKQKRRAYAFVGSQAVADQLDIGSNMLAEIRDLIHERYTRRQKRIGRVLQHLGCADIHQHHRPARAHKRRI